MIIENSDSLLIHSILHSEKDKKGAALVDIIAYADYVDHAIMTYEEFKGGLEKLKILNLVIEQGKALQTTHEFKIWWDKEFASKKRIYVQKELASIASYLKRLVEGDKEPDDKEIEETLIGEKDFQIAVDKYIQSFKK